MPRCSNSISLLLFSLSASVGLLAYDGNLSGVSDVYENLHGGILPASEDADLDGYSNYLESLFGSNPLDGADPGDFSFSVTGPSASISVPNQVGLRYRVESSLTLTADSWEAIGDFQVSDGLSGVVEFDVSEIPAAFFRVKLAPPLNSDGDGLNDWEEGQLGTNPLLSDSDNDLLDDDVEAMVAGSDPLKVDSDGDGFVDRDEFESGSDPNDSAEWPPEITQNAWSQPISIVNESAPIGSLQALWSKPVTVGNDALALGMLNEAWSAPVTMQNDALAIAALNQAWSAPVLVRNDALPIGAFDEVWSAPILVQNTFTETPSN